MALYIHVPFCGSKCTYCGFYSVASRAMEQQYIQAIQKELEIRKNYLPSSILHSLYVGGGTPSILSNQNLTTLIENIYKNFQFDIQAEKTIEVNPEDITLEKARLIKQLGFNRVSMGVQSFDDNVLKAISRRHSGQQAKDAIQNLRYAGIPRISCDIILGLPASNNDIIFKDLQTLIDLDIEHISVYMLSIDEGTILAMQQKKGKYTPPSEDKLADLFLATAKFLKRNGRMHYEISNFSVPGKESRHNNAYWHGKPYLGLGPAAHSFNGYARHWNVPSLKKYCESLNNNTYAPEEEYLSKDDRYNEKIMTTLRCSEGLYKKEIIQLNRIAWAQSDAYRKECIKTGYAWENTTHFGLTEEGWLLSDKIFSELFI